MKVLWFAVTPSMYAQNNISHNGGGWIASLEALVRELPNVKLGIAFEHEDTCFRKEGDGVIYYPINVWNSRWQRLKRKFIYETEENQLIPACIKVIDDFKPDVIHVFGSEWCFGLVAHYTNIPVVIHIQGSIPPYYNALYPAGYSKFDFIFYYKCQIKKIYNKFKFDNTFLKRAKREERILKLCRYYMGRTEWDKNLTQLLSPKSQYFYCSEALRGTFLTSDKIWHYHERSSIILVSTISDPLYKGIDVILKTAKILKENTNMNFEWFIFGVKEIVFHEWKTGIKASQVNVILKGAVSADQLKDELLNADIFIHPSYIDNSPNSICEAQILGLPVISTNVGGIPSLIEHNKNGLLVPANDPYTMTSYIQNLINNTSFSSMLGINAHKTALQRHNPNQILNDLLSVYNAIINNKKKDKKNNYSNV